jgi:hypothetical protein
MTTAQFILAIVYGVVFLIALGRLGMALSSGSSPMRALGWMFSTLGIGLYMEVGTPHGASFDVVMRGLIQLVAWVS